MKRTSIFLCGVLLLLSLTGCSNANEPADNGSSATTSVTQPEHSAPPAQSGTVSSHTESNSPEQSSTPPQSNVGGSSSATASVTPQSNVSSSSSATASVTPQSNAGGSSSATASVTPQSTEKPPFTEPPVQSSPASSQTETPSQPNESSQPESPDKKEESEYMMNIKIGENVLTATLEHNSSAEALLKLLSEKPITIRMSDYGSMEKVGTLPSSLPRNDEHIDTDACDLILYQGNQFVIYYDTNSWSLTRLGKINNMTQSELKSILGKGDVTVTLSRP